MTKDHLKNNWLVFFALILFLSLYFYKLFFLGYWYFYTEQFNFYSPVIASLHEALVSGDHLVDKLSTILMPLLLVFSVAVYGDSISAKTWFLTIFLFILIGISEFLVLQLKSTLVIKNLDLNSLNSTVFLAYAEAAQNSAITFLMVVFGLSGANGLQNRNNNAEQTNNSPGEVEEGVPQVESGGNKANGNEQGGGEMKGGETKGGKTKDGKASDVKNNLQREHV